MRILRHAVLWTTCSALALCSTPPALADVPAGTPNVTSSKYPIRVWYDSNATQALALEAVGYAEKSWEAEIAGMGFAVPLRTADATYGAKVEPGYDVFLTKAPAGAAATFEVLGDEPATPRTDCPTVGILEASLLGSKPLFADLISHTLHHAALHAVDCIEPQMPVFDTFTIAVQRIEGVSYAGFWDKEIKAFQSHPEWSFDDVPAVTSGPDIWYPFGSALYGLFLEERFGARDGKLLAAIWRRTPQEGHITDVLPLNREVAYADVDNVPTFVDAIDAELQTKGASFAAAHVDFATWRFLTGPDADGAHLRDADKYPQAAIDAQLAVSSLPVANAHPKLRVASWGSSYVRVDTQGLAKGNGLRFGFQGSPPYRWAATTLCLRQGAAAVATGLALDAGFAGKGDVAPADACRAIALVAVNLSDGAYDANKPKHDLDGDFTYSIDVVAAPRLDQVTPASIAQGAAGAAIELRGSGLVKGPKLALAVSGAGVVVDAVTWVSDESLSATVTVASDAPVGPRDLTLTTGLGAVAALPQALTITPGASADAGAEASGDAAVGSDADSGSSAANGVPAPPVAAGAGDSGCSCGVAGESRTGRDAAALLLGAVVVAISRARRDPLTAGRRRAPA